MTPSKGSATTEDSPCRRCSECTGAEHHWMDNSECYGPEDPSHCCKHCDAMGDDCETCGGDGGRQVDTEDGYVNLLCPPCKGFGVVVTASPRPRCACPRTDARDCLELRSGRKIRRLLDAETLADHQSDFDDGCQCACHSEDEDEHDE